ncbi:MAG: CRTAC1 family protein [Bryobacterales bacterium]|nr:CRTAC1 family protein [Bryobacterales bacterium]
MSCVKSRQSPRALPLRLAIAAIAATASLSAAPAAYEDIGERVGISAPVTFGGRNASDYILETTGTGAAIFDFDRDGDNDVLVVNGTTFELEPLGRSPGSMLYVNDGSGRFEEAAARLGLTAKGWGQGVCVGDFDNDGWEDLLLTRYGKNVLYRNTRGAFEDASGGLDQSGDGPRWGTGCSFLDYDSDGLLDVFVANYVDFDPATTPAPGSSGACEWKGVPVMCGPRGLPMARNALYRNRGLGRFEDVSQQAGILAPGGRYALGVAAADFDLDGNVDVYVACDMTPSLLYRNNGDGTFTEIGAEAGVAYSADGQLQAGMGIAVADYDGNGFLDVAKTNFSGDLPSLYGNEDGVFYEDLSRDAGLGTRQLLGWGALFVDADEDGWPDLMLANGHVYPEVDAAPIGESYRQLTLLYRNLGNGAFADVTDSSGPALQQPRPARGLAAGDLDGDGHPEIVVVNVNAPPAVLKNRARPGNAVVVRLRGRQSNRSGIGARVELTAGGRTALQAVISGGSYLSQNDLALHFGLGSSDSVDELRVVWPSGLEQSWTGMAGNQRYVLTEGTERPEARALVGRGAPDLPGAARP